MNRLTIKNSDGTHSQPTHTTFEKMFNRLAEFEDFMEENGFESLEDLKHKINSWVDEKRAIELAEESMKNYLSTNGFQKQLNNYAMYKLMWETLKNKLKNSIMTVPRKCDKSTLFNIEKFALLQVLELMDKLETIKVLEKDGENEKES